MHCADGDKLTLAELSVCLQPEGNRVAERRRNSREGWFSGPADAPSQPTAGSVVDSETWEKKQRDQRTVCPCPPEQLIRASGGRWLSNARLPMVAMCGCCLRLVGRLMNECRARRPLLWGRAINPHYVPHCTAFDQMSGGRPTPGAL